MPIEVESVKADRLYQELKEVAEKLGIEVTEQNFRATGINAVSGLCKVKGKSLFLIDKHKSLHKKITILSEFLGGMSCGDVYMLPAVREHLSRYTEADRLFPGHRTRSSESPVK
jgi:hypothetical protein